MFYPDDVRESQIQKLTMEEITTSRSSVLTVSGDLQHAGAGDTEVLPLLSRLTAS